VEALLAQADAELAGLGPEPPPDELAETVARAHKLAAGVDVEALLAPEPAPTATLDEATRALR
jgi:hypothetical protein